MKLNYIGQITPILGEVWLLEGFNYASQSYDPIMHYTSASALILDNPLIEWVEDGQEGYFGESADGRAYLASSWPVF